MTVSSTTDRDSFAGNGVTTVFPLEFRFFSNQDIRATLIDDATGAQLALTEGTDYTLFGAGLPEDDGNPASQLTMIIPPPVGKTLKVQRVMPVTQPTDIINQSRFYPEIHENVFDRLTMLIQQALGVANNSLQLDDLGQNWDAKGNRIINVGSPVEATDAATKGSVDQAIADALSTGQGPINNSANVAYVTPGAKLTTVQDKLRETVSLSDFNSLRDAIAYGQMVHVPAGQGTVSLNAADAAVVLQDLYKVDAEGDLSLQITGHASVASGPICRVGVRNSTIKLLGPTPVEVKASSVASVTGVSGDWQITYNITGTHGAVVGDWAKLYDVGPLPILMGDNAASYILRDYPQMGEIYKPLAQNVGAITYNNGGGSVSFASVNGALSQYMQSGDLVHSKGQSKRLNVIGSTSASIVGAWTNGGVTASSTYYISRPNAGTIGTGGVASQNITGVGSAFTTQASVDSILLVDGVMARVTAIGSDTALTVDLPLTIANGTSYSLLHPLSALHAGVHEIVAVTASTITVRNYSPQKPPVNGISVDEFKIIKASLKQTGTGDGFIFDQNGSLREINNIVIVGPSSGAGIGMLLQSRIPSETSSSGTSFGNVTQHGLQGTVLLGENVGITRFYRGAMTGHGCLLNARKLALTNNLEIGLWTLEGGFSNIRRVQITGGTFGTFVNSGGGLVTTETMLIGCSNDGMRADANASIYGECPIAVGCGGMNFRYIDSGTVHITDGVSFLSSLSGIYCDNASVRADRMVIGANARAAIELIGGSDFHYDNGWASGTSNTAGPGYGLQIGDNCTYIGTGSAFVGNEAADIAIVSGATNANAVVRNSYYPQAAIGITRLNSPNANGSAIWDGSAADTGTSVPAIGAAAGTTGTVTANALAWTRDKDRYEFDGRATITSIGDWTGYLTVALPFTVAANTAIAAINQTTGAALTGYAVGAQLRIYSSAGAFPAANGNIILFTGVVRA